MHHLPRLDDARLRWGHEVILQSGLEIVGSATRRFPITVGR